MKRVDDIGELDLIRRIAADEGASVAGVVVGIGDDAAVLEAGGGQHLLATCDSQIEGVHFRRDGRVIVDIGRRAAAVNLSDIAAMGGDPTFALVSLAATADCPVRDLEEIYEGLRVELRRHFVPVVGGNTARSTAGLIIDVTLLGRVPVGRALLRTGAREGDVVCVTGEIGGAAAGLLLSQYSVNDEGLDPEPRRAATDRHRTPRARVEVGRCLREWGRVTSCTDVSDGLIADAAHLGSAGGVCLVLRAEDLPIAGCARAVAAVRGVSAIELAATGGEDFELLFTVPEDSVGDVVSLVDVQAGVRVTPIGEVRSGAPGAILEEAGRLVSFDREGFEHFK